MAYGPSGCRLRKSTAATFDSYGQSTENSTLSTPSAITVQRKAGAEKLPLQVATRFSVKYCAGDRLRPRDVNRKIEVHMPSDRPGMLMRGRLLALLESHREKEVPR
jgi:hypothetical protein